MAPAQSRRRVVLPAVAAAALSLVALGNSRSFVQPPPARQDNTAALMAAVGAAAVLSPLAAHADLPPLEELKLEEIAPTRQYGPTEGEDDTFLGVTFNQYIFIFPIVLGWAYTWINTLKPAKDEDGTYKTYVGGGELPPIGFTNPLDPRVDDEIADEEDPIYGEAAGNPKGKKGASSAIV
eukprot:TRINITY_DN3472_c1_g1_i1.p1 TRINITY_DN3472_c1_g1~~TRINITY_DN3472_c1_g1_i1.p1  ORF type:complete len:180 (+),score=59.49 TRINITY_DN3472_c1_g1_i1:78-617(+)